MNQTSPRNIVKSPLSLRAREIIHRHIILLASRVVDHIDVIEPEVAELDSLPLSEVVKELEEFGIDLDEEWKAVVRNRQLGLAK
jgi:hypothetical protein